MCVCVWFRNFHCGLEQALGAVALAVKACLPQGTGFITSGEDSTPLVVLWLDTGRPW